MGFIENICSRIDNGRNVFVSIFSGMLFFTGWWFFIDAFANYPDILSENKIYVLPGICGTIAFAIINATPYRTEQDINFYETTCPPFVINTILFLGLVALFGSFIGAVYIWVADFLLVQSVPAWPGVAIMLQNFFILISVLQMKFGINTDTM